MQSGDHPQDNLNAQKEAVTLVTPHQGVQRTSVVISPKVRKPEYKERISLLKCLTVVLPVNNQCQKTLKNMEHTLHLKKPVN
tara:strand:+ start:65 stop:310 length:246 start_codon:yes stop_codon:yes gene_type:complete